MEFHFLILPFPNDICFSIQFYLQSSKSQQISLQCTLHRRVNKIIEKNSAAICLDWLGWVESEDFHTEVYRPYLKHTYLTFSPGQSTSSHHEIMYNYYYFRYIYTSSNLSHIMKSSSVFILHILVRYVTTVNIFLMSMTVHTTYLHINSIYTVDATVATHTVAGPSYFWACSLWFSTLVLLTLLCCAGVNIVHSALLSCKYFIRHVELSLSFFSKQLKDNFISLQCTWALLATFPWYL